MTTTLTTNARVSSMTDHERIREITRSIKTADRSLRNRFAIFQYQSGLGVAFFALAAGISIVTAGLFLGGLIPGWLCVAINAICFAVIREIEHDLIHNLYFPNQSRLQNLMMLLVWPFLGNLPHPWYRRRMHLLHHRTSGHDEDFEEQLIGNGVRFGPLKLLAMFEPGLASLFRQKEFARIPFYRAREFYGALFPVANLYLLITYGCLFLNLAMWFGGMCQIDLPEWIGQLVSPLNMAAVVWVLPNMLRQVCLQIISSNMHYFGDVETRMQETQVMNAWWLFPLNLFTCNFGSTHSIHHFVVNQPFYLRQLVAGTAHRAFQQYGVRYNDMGTILRGNRYSK